MHTKTCDIPQLNYSYYKKQFIKTFLTIYIRVSLSPLTQALTLCNKKHSSHPTVEMPFKIFTKGNFFIQMLKASPAFCYLVD